MLNNKRQRIEYIRNKSNWELLHEMPEINFRIITLRLNAEYEILQFQTKMEKDSYIHKAGDWIQFPCSGQYWLITNGGISLMYTENGIIDFMTKNKEVFCLDA